MADDAPARHAAPGDRETSTGGTGPDVPSAPIICSLCGRSGGGTSALTWSSSRSGTRTSWVCGDCTRRHVRSMEAKLDEEHW